MEKLFNKLRLLLKSKQDIKNAIFIKSGKDPGDIMSSYADRIMEIGTEPSILNTTILIDQTNSTLNIKSIEDNGGVQYIRNNSHRFLCKNIDGILHIKQIRDNNGNLLLNGKNLTFASSDGDIMMKLPKFYYKAWSKETDKWYIDFVYGQKPDDDYFEWSGDEFIGCYEGTIINNNLYSISNTLATYGVSPDYGRQCAKNRGAGYSITTWKEHSIMAFLYLAWYLNPDSQTVCGYGSTTYTTQNGDSNAISMTDTNSENGNTQAVNFWGLERWWGGSYEWLDNVYAGENNLIVTEDSVLRELSSTNESGYTSKLSIGERLDAAPTFVSSELSGYYDRFYYTSDGHENVTRSGSLRNPYSGVFYLACRRSGEDVNKECVVRLSYKGPYKIIY